MVRIRAVLPAPITGAGSALSAIQSGTSDTMLTNPKEVRGHLNEVTSRLPESRKVQVRLRASDIDKLIYKYI